MIIVLNGPPNCGKDTIGVELFTRGYVDSLLRFKERLYRDTALHYNIPLSYVIELATNRETKDKPHKLFKGRSPREALIHVSEDVEKKVHGKDRYGKKLADLILSQIVMYDFKRFVVTDGGFSEEIEALKLFADMEVVIVQIEREGCSFKGDSRNYVDNGDVVFRVENNSTVDEAVDAIATRLGLKR